MSRAFGYPNSWILGKLFPCVSTDESTYSHFVVSLLFFLFTILFFLLRLGYYHPTKDFWFPKTHHELEKRQGREVKCWTQNELDTSQDFSQGEITILECLEGAKSCYFCIGLREYWHIYEGLLARLSWDHWNTSSTPSRHCHVVFNTSILRIIPFYSCHDYPTKITSWFFFLLWSRNRHVSLVKNGSS